MSTTHTKHHPLIVFPPGTITGIKPFVAEAAKTNLGEEQAEWSASGNIETGNILDQQKIYAGPECNWHTDSWTQVACSALLVLRNDAASWVECQGKRVSRVQPVGTLVLLDVRWEHRLTCRKPAPPGALWIALVLDYQETPTQDACVADMQRLVRTPGLKPGAYK